MAGTGMHSQDHWDKSDAEAEKTARKNLRPVMEKAADDAKTPESKKKARQDEMKEKQR